MDESELDELLQRAIDPYVPVELFYAVLDRIGRPVGASGDAHAVHQPPAHAAAPTSTHALQSVESHSFAPQSVESQSFDVEPDMVPLPDATVLMEQVEQLEAAMAGD